MSTTIATIGQALYDLFADLDITGIYAGGWQQTANYPLKQIVAPFPAFSVYPADDTENDLDSITDDVTITYWVYLYESFQDPATIEPKFRQLVDLCRTELRKEKRSSTPLGGAAYTLGTITGEWGFDIELGLRFYRFSIQAKVDEETI